ncbi:MAG: Alt protein, partial [Melanogrammus aeglefinus-associated papillomavirus 1]
SRKGLAIYQVSLLFLCSLCVSNRIWYLCLIMLLK